MNIDTRTIVAAWAGMAVLLAAPTTSAVAQPARSVEEIERAEQARREAEEEALQNALREEEAAARRVQAERESSERESAARAAVADREAALDESRRVLVAQERELAAARRELAESRRELEQAAREVARLSALPVTRDLKEFGRRFVTFGEPRRAMLGVLIDDANGGAVVMNVSPGGPAAEAGVEVGDTIVAVDGVAVDAGDGSPTERVLRQLREVVPGDNVHLVMLRDGERREIDVEAGANLQYFITQRAALPVTPDVDVPRPASIQVGPFGDVMRSFTFFATPWNELELVSLTPELGRYFGASEGLLVVRAPDDDSIGLEDGDVITAIGTRTPISPEHAMRILASFEPGETVDFTIMREQRRQSIEYPIPGDTD